ncbi:MAG: creatininase family protein, partial [Gemmatimonadota bacterium]|nr:creatininase family protein [Gemmatimonadota bacterium]
MENHLWGHATWTELASLGLAVRGRSRPSIGGGGAGGSTHSSYGSRVVALLPTGAVEAHGPHLPLTTDVIIATAAAQAAVPGLRRLGLHPVVLPPLPYTAAPFAAGFAGTISVRAATIAALLTDVAASLERQGAAALVVVNAHLDPAHLEAIGNAVRGRGAGAAAPPPPAPGDAPPPPPASAPPPPRPRHPPP